MDISLNNAYKLYEQHILLLETIVDSEDNFIAVSEFAELINTIVGIKSIRGQHITNLLIDRKIITKKDKTLFNKQVKLNQSPNKYVLQLSNIYNLYVVERLYNDYSHKISFYLWNGLFLFKLLGIDFSKPINTSHINTFCSVLKPYIRDVLDKVTIFNNILLLQCYLRQYIIADINFEI